YPSYQIFTLDKLTYAGSFDNLKEVENKSNYTFIKAYIADAQLDHSIFEPYNINDVIHLGAESHIDCSIKDATSSVETNVLSTCNIDQDANINWEKATNYRLIRNHHE